MSDATIIAVVTIVCSAAVTIVQLLVRSEVVNLKKLVKEQIAKVG